MFDITFLKTLNVLYLESNITTGNRFTIMLTKMFNNVHYSTNASEALEICQKEKLNIIICDLVLKDKSGIELIKELRESNNDIPVILTTQESSTSDLMEAIKLNVDDFLIKPLNPKDLVSAVENICHKKFQDELEKQTIKNLDDMINIVNEIALVTKTNLNQEIIFANDSFCNVTGFTSEELVGNTHDLIREANSNATFFENINKSIQSGKTWEGKLKNFTKNKEEFYVHLTAIPILDEEKNVKEFMWVRFLITEYEQEKKEFKKNVAKNIHQNRRVNNDAREKIDMLMKKLAHYENLDKAILLEKHRDAKFKNQNEFYITEIKEGEEKLKSISEIANKKIKEVIQSEKITRELKNKIDKELAEISGEFQDKNKEIQDLTVVLDECKKTIKDLEQKIINIESSKR